MVFTTNNNMVEGDVGEEKEAKTVLDQGLIAQQGTTTLMELTSAVRTCCVSPIYLWP